MLAECPSPGARKPSDFSDTRVPRIKNLVEILLAHLFPKQLYHLHLQGKREKRWRAGGSLRAHGIQLREKLQRFRLARLSYKRRTFTIIFTTRRNKCEKSKSAPVFSQQLASSIKTQNYHTTAATPQEASNNYTLTTRYHIHTSDTRALYNENYTSPCIISLQHLKKRNWRYLSRWRDQYLPMFWTTKYEELHAQLTTARGRRMPE